jgi:hypothetical protein
MLSVTLKGKKEKKNPSHAMKMDVSKRTLLAMEEP